MTDEMNIIRTLAACMVVFCKSLIISCQHNNHREIIILSLFQCLCDVSFVINYVELLQSCEKKKTFMPLLSHKIVVIITGYLTIRKDLLSPFEGENC